MAVQLNSNYNRCNRFKFCGVDKVTTDASSFVSVILNSIAPVTAETTQFVDEVGIRLISQLISDISRVLQIYLSIIIVQLFQNFKYSH